MPRAVLPAIAGVAGEDVDGMDWDAELEAEQLIDRVLVEDVWVDDRRLGDAPDDGLGWQLAVREHRSDQSTRERIADRFGKAFSADDQLPVL